MTRIDVLQAHRAAERVSVKFKSSVYIGIIRVRSQDAGFAKPVVYYSSAHCEERPPFIIIIHHLHFSFRFADNPLMS